MDTLKAISTSSPQSTGSVQAPADNGVSVNAVATPSSAAMPAKLPEQDTPKNEQEISSAVKEINNFFQTAHRSLEFSLDEFSGRMVMQIKDTQTNEVVRQIPGEDAIKIAKQLDELTGVLFKARA